jgi:DNA-binding NtrC family response regulator
MARVLDLARRVAKVESTTLVTGESGAGKERLARLIDLPEELRAALPRPRPSGAARPLADVEKEYILAAVEAAGGNRTRAATDLQIGLATLKRKLKAYSAERGVAAGRSAP